MKYSKFFAMGPQISALIPAPYSSVSEDVTHERGISLQLRPDLRKADCSVAPVTHWGTGQAQEEEKFRFVFLIVDSKLGLVIYAIQVLHGAIGETAST